MEPLFREWLDMHDKGHKMVGESYAKWLVFEVVSHCQAGGDNIYMTLVEVLQDEKILKRLLEGSRGPRLK
jgi:hypothetical protein